MNQEQPEPIKLKPVIFYGNNVSPKHQQNSFQQMLLLKAMAVTQDPEELKKMAGMKSVTEVYRTLDKMMIRREYHDALSRCGVDLDFLVRGLRDIAIGGIKDADRLNALKALMKSIGLDAYKETAIGGGSGWEETLLQKDAEQRELGEGDGTEDYDVSTPLLPDSVRQSHAEEAEALRGIYE